MLQDADAPNVPRRMAKQQSLCILSPDASHTNYGSDSDSNMDSDGYLMPHDWFDGQFVPPDSPLHRPTVQADQAAPVRKHTAQQESGPIGNLRSTATNPIDIPPRCPEVSSHGGRGKVPPKPLPKPKGSVYSVFPPVVKVGPINRHGQGDDTESAAYTIEPPILPWGKYRAGTLRGAYPSQAAQDNKRKYSTVARAVGKSTCGVQMAVSPPLVEVQERQRHTLATANMSMDQKQLHNALQVLELHRYADEYLSCGVRDKLINILWKIAMNERCNMDQAELTRLLQYLKGCSGQI